MNDLVRRLLEARFPNLGGQEYEVTSSPSRIYNCFAWAAADPDRWWEPIASPGCYWPPAAVFAYTLDSFLTAFETLGFNLCESGEFELGFKKVAIYAKDQLPTHASRQLPDGAWTSKLGSGHDIRHALLTGLEGDEYRHVALVLRRPARG